jgi:hypothetical protein
MILRAGDGHDKALEDLCERYWFPLYAFCRRSGNSEADGTSCETLGWTRGYRDCQREAYWPAWASTSSGCDASLYPEGYFE